MSKLDELIEKLCPNGVQRYILKDICSFQNGFAFKSILFKNQGEKILRITNINDGNITDKNCVYFNVSDYKEDLTSYKVTKGDIVIAMSGATTGKIGCNYSDSTYYLNQRVGLFRPNEKILHKRYLYHWLLSKTNEIYNISSDTGAQENLSSLKMMNFKIPVPPLEIQNEIVEILDKFTALLAELKAELKARKKQYAYYKQKMFDDIKTDTIKHITDIAFVKSRVGWQNLTRKEYLTVGDYHLVTGTDFTTDGNINFEKCVYVSKDRYEMDKNIQVHKDDILITKDGTLGKVAILKEEPKKETTLNSGIFRITVINKNEVYPNYLYHFFTSSYFKDFVESVKTSSTISHLTQQGLLTLNIPIPNIEEQRNIADILDKFEELCNSLTEGIPAEIEARQKQYEYYRDKLLTFKELGSNK